MSADALAPKRRSLTRPTQCATHGLRETLKGDSAPHAQPSNAVISPVLCRSRARSGHVQLCNCLYEFRKLEAVPGGAVLASRSPSVPGARPRVTSEGNHKEVTLFDGNTESALSWPTDGR